MMGLILIVICGLVFTGLMGHYISFKYKSDKEVGPLPWQHNYDMARQDRLLREEQEKRAKNKTPIDIGILEEIL